MRYRRVAMVVRASQSWSVAEMWPVERVRFLVQAGWRPDADVYETATAIEVTVDLAGVGEDDAEIQLFDDAVVVEGYRQVTPRQDGGVYHAAAIRRGPFRVDIPLPAPVDADGVQARLERGLLRITLPKLGRGR